VISNKTPNCFGLVVCLSTKSQQCQNCEFFTRCKQKTAEHLSCISVKMNVEDYIAALRREGAEVSHTIKLVGSPEVQRKTKVYTLEITKREQQALEEIKGRYSKAERLLKYMYKHGIDLHANLIQGVNPFKYRQSHRYMYVACKMLLDQGFTNSELRSRLMKENDWSYGTANSHVLIVVHTLLALSVVRTERGRYKIWGS